MQRLSFSNLSHDGSARAPIAFYAAKELTARIMNYRVLCAVFRENTTASYKIISSPALTTGVSVGFQHPEPHRAGRGT